MADEPYKYSYSPNGKDTRKALPEGLWGTFLEIEDSLSEAPDQYPQYTIELSDNIYLYKHPDPEIQVTYKLDTKNHEIEYLHVVAPLTDVSKPVFISYCHEDKTWLDELKKYLNPLEKQDIIKIWDDTQIKAGVAWEDEIKRKLLAAKAAILLVSQDFLISDFIANDELPQLLEKSEKEGLKVFWIALSASTVTDSHPQIAKYQAVHVDPPLDQLEAGKQKQAFLEISQKIKKGLEA